MLVCVIPGGIMLPGVSFNGEPFVPEKGSQITQNSKGEIVINWQRVENAVSYEIFHSGSRLGAKTLLTTTSNDDLSYTHTNPNSVKYENYYTIVPRDSEGSAIVGIKWNSIDNAVEYRVERADTPTGVFTAIETVTERMFVESVPDYDEKQTTYRISPLNDGGNIIMGVFDTDSPAHTRNGSNIRGYSITRNIVTKNIYPISISFEGEMFGENVYFYDAKYDDMSDILCDVNRIADAMRSSVNAVQMSAERYSIYFKPGDYPLAQNDARGTRLDIGFYMTVAGLGLLPAQTRLGVTVYTPPALAHSNNNGDNGTHNFWRAIENFEIYSPTDSPVTLGWAVSQAAPMRRILVANGVTTNYNMNGGWVSGGFAADIRFEGNVTGGGQQQWITRNSHFGGSAMTGIGWNNFVNASTGAAFPGNYMSGGSKIWVADGIDQMKEKPFLYYDTDINDYKVFVPGLRQNAIGPSWTSESPGVGYSIDIGDFYMTKPGDSATKINTELDKGKNIFYTPGMYECEIPVYITNDNTVVIGTGLATIYPGESNNEGAMLVSDVSGVTLASFIVDAHFDSKYLLRVGEVGSNQDHSENPTFISDVFARLGGYKSNAVHAEVSVDIHSNNVIGDHFWIWLADHGRGTGWENNTGAFGLIVHGDDVSMHGLFVEHYQKYQTLWLGERGSVYFYQNELPYPVPDQAAWMSHDGTVNGWAAFKVANHVNEFYAVGLGSYSTLRRANILLANAIEVPNNKPGVKVEAMYANNISQASSGILNIINGAGGRAVGVPGKRIAVFNNGMAQQWVSDSLQNLNCVAVSDEDLVVLLANIYK